MSGLVVQPHHFNLISLPRSGTKLVVNFIQQYLSRHGYDPHYRLHPDETIAAWGLGEYLHCRSFLGYAFEHDSLKPYAPGKKIWKFDDISKLDKDKYCFFNVEYDPKITNFRYVKSTDFIGQLRDDKLVELTDQVLSLPRSWVMKTFPTQLYDTDNEYALTPAVIDEQLMRIANISKTFILKRYVIADQICSRYMIYMSNLTVPGEDQAYFIKRFEKITIPEEFINDRLTEFDKFDQFCAKLYPGIPVIYLGDVINYPVRTMAKLGIDLVKDDVKLLRSIMSNHQEYNKHVSYKDFITNYDQIARAA